MIHRTFVPLTLVALLLGAGAQAQDTSKAPEMTPEQKAEMEAVHRRPGHPGRNTRSWPLRQALIA